MGGPLSESDCSGSFVNSMVIKFWNHKITGLYTNLCYNEMCYKGTAL